MKNINFKLLLVLTLVIFLNSCKKESKTFEKNSFWENFKTKLEKNDLEYLIKNSFDSIQCIDCVPNERGMLYSPKFIYINYKNEFYDKIFLDEKKYSVYQKDSIIRINYSFKGKFGNEGHNIIYMFDKKENKFLLSGMIKIP
mgnify:CR=1 FL=1